ncbi:hypothetical protein FHX82_007361, partial [Amycolatopsis bartoniae]
MTDTDVEHQQASDSAAGRHAVSDDPANTSASLANAPSSPRLQSLTSRYVAEQHETYLRHLREVTKDPKNRNIALTGRYGTGKSSVLDQFESENEHTTLRLTISTLGPTSKEESLTNRIQKELVKQLLYRAPPRKMRFSRFNRITPLSRTRAAIEASAAVGVLGLILWFLGWLPRVAGTGAGHHWLLRAAAGVGFAVLAIVVVTVLRLVIYGRFVISDVSAAGATVKLTRETSTYFDEYLEEIVYFFDENFPELVIFEDLDRFDDPHIFEALRELNTLLNNTSERVSRRTPLRFVYAIKDSLFERLGTDPETTPDAAAAETVRANRTKFFDVVIPIVPFLSHRNARELLDGLLKAGKLTEIDRDLVTLVAQHATDMRLLKNICNEYAVFAERLLASGKTAPGLTPSDLFALVVYKNFHLKDFEEIARRNSALDVLYDCRRDLVRAAINHCERRKRELLSAPGKHRAMADVANRLGRQLIEVGSALRSVSGWAGWPYLAFRVDSNRYSQNSVDSYEFWVTATRTGRIDVLATNDPSAGHENILIRLDQEQIRTLFPEATGADQWAVVDADTNREAIDQLDSDIRFLRGADFCDLAQVDRFTLPLEAGRATFADVIDTAMKSQLARELVKRGYLNRNFALYAAQFYGDFTGLDVANFIVQVVQPNRMEIDFDFKTPASIENLLKEVSRDFTRTVSAYNIEILDYLLEQRDIRGEEIIDTIVSNFGDHARQFLDAYLNSGSQRSRLAALLSRHPWSEVFTYLVRNENVPENIRSALVGAALQNARDGKAYELGTGFRDFVTANYRDMDAFTSHQPAEVADTIVSLIKRAQIILPELAGLAEAIRVRVVREHLYQLTGDNLRVALGGTEDISLDQVHKNADVYELCRLRPEEYFAAVAADARTKHSVNHATTLAKVLTEVVESWEAAQVRELIATTAPEARLEQIDTAPESCWPDLAAYRLFRATVENVQAYRSTIGSIDQNLADLLVGAGKIDTGAEDEDVRRNVAVNVLNASDTIPRADRRVNLVATLALEEYLSPVEIEP